jgi:hypothetical protein
VALGHGALDGNSAFDRWQDAAELRQNAVPGRILDAPTVLLPPTD